MREIKKGSRPLFYFDGRVSAFRTIRAIGAKPLATTADEQIVLGVLTAGSARRRPEIRGLRRRGQGDARQREQGLFRQRLYLVHLRVEHRLQVLFVLGVASGPLAALRHRRSASWS